MGRRHRDRDIEDVASGLMEHNVSDQHVRVGKSDLNRSYNGAFSTHKEPAVSCAMKSDLPDGGKLLRNRGTVWWLVGECFLGKSLLNDLCQGPNRKTKENVPMSEGGMS